jgi:alkylation response protein AidB-like acyl-CoA dehydrogenase
MDFSLTDEQQLLLASLREIMAESCTEAYLKDCERAGRYPQEFLDALVESDFALLGVPEEYGGVPADVTTMMLVAEEITKNGGPNFAFGQALSIADMLQFGSPEQIAQCMDEIKSGHVGFILGFTEPQAGSDSSAIATTYTRRDGKVHLTGHKTFMSNGLRAKYLLCVAKNGDAPAEGKKNAFSMWWVPMDAPGITVEPIEKIGWHMLDTCEIYLDDVVVEEKDLVGVEGNGFVQAMVNFEVERLLMAASCLGVAECAFEDAASWAAQRVQFGKPIGSFQLIQEKLTRMKTKIECMRGLVYKAAWLIDQKLPVNEASAIAKLFCAQSCFEVCDDALQIMGGIGYTTECRVSRMWLESRVQRIGGGTDEVMIHIVGRGIVKAHTP